MKKCELCNFWYPKGKNRTTSGEILYGECRRNTPNGVDGRAKWPNTNESDWCGEFKTKLLLEG